MNAQPSEQPAARSSPLSRARHLLSQAHAAALALGARQRIPEARGPFSESTTATELKDRPAPSKEKRLRSPSRDVSSHSHYQLTNPVRAECLVKINDAALAARAQTLDFTSRRKNISHGSQLIHFALIPSEEDGQRVLDTLSTSPVLGETFAPQKGLFIRTSSSTRVRLQGVEEAHRLLGNARAEPERAYIVSAIEHASVLESEELTPTVRSIDWSSFSKHQLLAILYALVGKLSRVHAAGYKAGDTKRVNIGLLRGQNPCFLSAGQLERLRPGLTFGVPELLYLLNDYRAARLIGEKESRLLLAYYLQQPTSMDHARDYLSSVKTNSYRPGVPLVDQLYERLDASYLAFHALDPVRSN